MLELGENVCFSSWKLATMMGLAEAAWPTKNNVGIGWTSLSLCVLILCLCRRYVLSPTFHMFWFGRDATCVSALVLIGWRVCLRILGVRCLSEDLLVRLSANCAWR